MRQISILPAGCQVRNKSSLYMGGGKFYYASTLSIYVYNASTYVLEKVVTVSERSLASISVSPFDDNYVVTVAIDGVMSLWKLNEEVLVGRVNTGISSRYHIVEWDVHSKSNCVLITSEPSIRVLNWEAMKSSNTGSMVELFSVKKSGIRVTCAQWNPHSPGLLAAGCQNSFVFLFNAREKTQKLLQAKDRTTGVVDLQWDRLSSVYVLVAYQYFLSLWDSETGNELQVFEKQNNSITSISWMDWTAGNFISSNAKNGTLKIWNASQKQPLESLRLGAVGINSMMVSSLTRKLFSCCSDGSVAMFNLKNHSAEFSTTAGHTDTIFDCNFCPTNPELFGTASFDGTVKLWNISTMTLQRTFYAGEATLYSLAWSRRGTIVSACTAVGSVILWDVESGSELARYVNHSKASYCLQWNPFSDSMLCSTSSDGNLVVFEVDLSALYNPQSASLPTGSRKKTDEKLASAEGNVLLRYSHPGPVFGCSWSPHNQNLVATGCQDGKVRVLNVNESKPLAYELSGHSARSFNCTWSPLIRGMLASGSDDTSIIVWQVEIDSELRQSTAAKQVTRLIGHKSNVRALTFCHEHRQILLSGAWDSTIRLWDVFSGACIKVIHCHAADVYSLSSHPERPFVFISCSRDTTVRVWELVSVIRLLKLTAAWDCSLERVIDDDSNESSLWKVLGYNSNEEDQWNLGQSEGKSSNNSRRLSRGSVQSGKLVLKPTLCGARSVYLHNQLSSLVTTSGEEKSEVASQLVSLQLLDPITMANRYYRLYNFFGGSNGSLELWEAVLALLAERNGDGPIDPNSSSGSLMSLNAKRSYTSIRPSNVPKQIIFEGEILNRAKSEAKKIESSMMTYRKGESNSAKTEELLRKAALLHARLGHINKYCKIMVELGDYVSALSVAPAVSLDYWRSLVTAYSKELSEQASEKCIPLMISVGNNADAVDFYLQRRDVESALVVAKSSEFTRNPASANSPMKKVSSSPRLDWNEEVTSSALDLDDISWSMKGQNNQGSTMVDADANCPAESEAERWQAKAMIRLVAKYASDQYYNASKPILAAAQYIAVDDANAAIDVLVAAEEFDLAYAVAKCLRLDCSNLTMAVAEAAAELCAIPLSLEMLKSVQDAERQKGLLLGKFCSDASVHRTLAAACGVRPASNWSNQAVEEEAIGSDVNAVQCYILSRDYSRAATIGLTALRRVVREPLSATPEIKKMLKALHHIRATELSEPLRSTFLCHMFWFSAHEAAEEGMWQIGWDMLRILRDKAAPGMLSIAAGDIIYQELIFRITAGDEEAVSMLQSLVQASVPVQVQDSLRTLRALLWEASTAQSGSTNAKSEAAASESSKISPRDGGKSVWGVNTATIFRESQRLSDALQLPSLTKLQTASASNRKASCSGLASIVLGSSLPSAPSVRRETSFISQKIILGAAVPLNEAKSIFVSENELASWKRVNPYNPTGTGEFVPVVDLIPP